MKKAKRSAASAERVARRNGESALLTRRSTTTGPALGLRLRSNEWCDPNIRCRQLIRICRPYFQLLP